MSIEVAVQPPFEDEWTTLVITGVHVELVLNILIARFLAAEYEVRVENEEGEMVPAEEYET